MKTFEEQLGVDVQRALEEDVGTGDLTAALVPAGCETMAKIICREEAVIRTSQLAIYLDASLCVGD